MILKPWREIVTPHPDVAAGRYRQAEFAADLAQVLASCSDAAGGPRAGVSAVRGVRARRGDWWTPSAEAALAYNGPVVSWPEIEKLTVRRDEGEQERLL